MRYPVAIEVEGLWWLIRVLPASVFDRPPGLVTTTSTVPSIAGVRTAIVALSRTVAVILLRRAAPWRLIGNQRR